MAAAGSTKVVLAALAGNTLIAITKFAASVMTGSSAMFSEAVHSVVDTGNQALLLYGLRRAEKPADETHPFGYAKEIYFWSFVVAILLFSIGAGVSFYEGVEKVLHPEEIKHVYINYIVLGFAMVFESIALWIAVLEFNERRGSKPVLRAIQESKDPSLVTVLMEDTAAMIGLTFALVGITLAHVLEMPVFDGLASIAIGCVLASAATLLAWETKSLLIGEAASPHLIRGVRQIVGAQRGILRTNEVLTMHLGPSDVLVNVSVDFHDNLDSAEIERSVSEMESRIKMLFPEVSRLFIEVQSWQAHMQSLRRAT